MGVHCNGASRGEALILAHNSLEQPKFLYTSALEVPLVEIPNCQEHHECPAMKAELLELLQCPGQWLGQFSFADTQTVLAILTLLFEPDTQELLSVARAHQSSSVILSIILSCSFMPFWAASFYSSLQKPQVLRC